MAEVATEIAKKMEEKAETPVTVAPTKAVEASEAETKVTVTPPKTVETTKKPAGEEVKPTETSSLVGKLETDVEIDLGPRLNHLIRESDNSV